MKFQDENKDLVKQLSDKSRRVASQHGKSFLVPHKFTESGEVVDESNFNPRKDLSRLSLQDFRLLAALQSEKWDFAKACKKADLPEEKAKSRLKRLKYFQFEEEKAKSLAALVTPDFVTSKNLENFYTDTLTDGQRDSLKEMAKITGAYKQANVSINTNVFNLPALTPEQEKAYKALGDQFAMNSINTTAERDVA